MEKPKTQLGYLESISQVLALKIENLVTERYAIWQLFKQADEGTFYQLAPHLFVTTNQEDPMVVSELDATPEGYLLFKELVEEEAGWF
ncbi:lignostilbene-alpha,beta-dioxygenase [Streptococcus pneumoniae]|nr:lignostilbene-alpha,beta-dioxygenase [Streptococcus pneumoniae]